MAAITANTMCLQASSAWLKCFRYPTNLMLTITLGDKDTIFYPFLTAKEIVTWLKEI